MPATHICCCFSLPLSTQATCLSLTYTFRWTQMNISYSIVIGTLCTQCARVCVYSNRRKRIFYYFQIFVCSQPTTYGIELEWNILQMFFFHVIAFVWRDKLANVSLDYFFFPKVQEKRSTKRFFSCLLLGPSIPFCFFALSLSLSISVLFFFGIVERTSDAFALICQLMDFFHSIFCPTEQWSKMRDRIRQMAANKFERVDLRLPLGGFSTAPAYDYNNTQHICYLFFFFGNLVQRPFAFDTEENSIHAVGKLPQIERLLHGLCTVFV